MATLKIEFEHFDFVLGISFANYGSFLKQFEQFRRNDKKNFYYVNNEAFGNFKNDLLDEISQQLSGHRGFCPDGT